MFPLILMHEAGAHLFQTLARDTIEKPLELQWYTYLSNRSAMAVESSYTYR